MNNESKHPAVEIVQDVTQPMNNVVLKPTKTFGNAINGVSQLILYPFLKANIYLEQHFENYTIEQREKINAIREENRIEPPMNILLPSMEALKCCLDQDELRSMFSTLLANSMDVTKKNIAHPSFVDIIRQLSASDAKYINELKNGCDFYYTVVEYREQVEELKSYRVLLTNISEPEPDITLINKNSIILTNLDRLGLIKIDLNKSLNDEIYLPYKTNEMMVALKPFQENSENEIKIKQGNFTITPYGKLFIDCCL